MLGGLQTKLGFTIPPSDLETYVTLEEDRVIAKLKEKLVPCDGVMPVLERLSKSGKYKLAVVSSSAKRRVIASVEKVDQAKYFQPVEDLVFSAATSLSKPTSKPDPAVYLFALDKLGVGNPKMALAIEDSKSGATAGIRAGIPVIG
jgi:beta-phosphoglucomutase-like phosphatase (HAD superfamily)